MWQDDDSSLPLNPDDEQARDQPSEQYGDPDQSSSGFASEFGSAASDEQQDRPPPGADFPGNLVPPTALPHIVPVMDLYEAARVRAVADQQLSKLFNPEYYI